MNIFIILKPCRDNIKTRGKKKKQVDLFNGNYRPNMENASFKKFQPKLSSSSWVYTKIKIESQTQFKARGING